MGKGRERLNTMQPIGSASRSIPELQSAAAPAIPARLFAPKGDVRAWVCWVTVWHHRTTRWGCHHGGCCQWDTHLELHSGRKLSLNNLNNCCRKMEYQREHLCLRARRGCVGLQGVKLCTFDKSRSLLPSLPVQTSRDGWIGADPGIC